MAGSPGAGGAPGATDGAGGAGPASETSGADAARYRSLLFSIAYGMTGSVGDAEDIVQDAFLGLTRARRAGTVVVDLKAYLATAVTRLGINHLTSARVRRETYVGDWLPEPVVVTADRTGPAEHAELSDSLSMAFLVLLEVLSPMQRAVFMLREAFSYGYPEVAGITGKSEANCRQIFARAKRQIAAERQPPPGNPEPGAPPAVATTANHAPAGRPAGRPAPGSAPAGQPVGASTPAEQTGSDQATGHPDGTPAPGGTPADRPGEGPTAAEQTDGRTPGAEPPAEHPAPGHPPAGQSSAAHPDGTPAPAAPPAGATTANHPTPGHPPKGHPPPGQPGGEPTAAERTGSDQAAASRAAAQRNTVRRTASAAPAAGRSIGRNPDAGRQPAGDPPAGQSGGGQPASGHATAERATTDAPIAARRAAGERLTRAFFDAAEGGDMGVLLGLLAPDVVFHGDGGGKAQAIGRPVAERGRVAKLFVGGLRRVRKLGASYRPARVNGRPGAVMYDAEGRVAAVVELDIVDGLIHAIHSVSNPDKLSHLGPVSDLGRLPSP